MKIVMADKKEKSRAIARKYYQRHKAERLLYAREHRGQHHLVAMRWAQNHKAERKAYYLKHREQIKARVLAHYANSPIAHCIVCGMADPDVLCLDHINDDAVMRGHRGKGGANFYLRLEQANYPKGYQTLCANCNLKKELKRRRNCASS